MKEEQTIVCKQSMSRKPTKKHTHTMKGKEYKKKEYRNRNNFQRPQFPQGHAFIQSHYRPQCPKR